MKENLANLLVGLENLRANASDMEGDTLSTLLDIFGRAKVLEFRAAKFGDTNEINEIYYGAQDVQMQVERKMKSMMK